MFTLVFQRLYFIFNIKHIYKIINLEIYSKNAITVIYISSRTFFQIYKFLFQERYLKYIISCLKSYFNNLLFSLVVMINFLFTVFIFLLLSLSFLI